MKFVSIWINNFLTIRSAKLELADRGLNVIQGRNLEDTSASSNGSGKSTIADALSWCLYGITAREVSGDLVVNEVEGKNCRVAVEVHDGDTAYMIRRHRKHKEFKNRLMIECRSMSGSPDWVPLDKGTEAESQKVLNRILGSSFNVFVSAIYSAQERVPNLPKMTDKELKTLVEEAAGLQRIEAAYRIARERMNANAALVSNQEVLKTQLEDRGLALSAKFTEALKNRDDWTASRDGVIEDMVNRLVKPATEAARTCAAFLVESEKRFTPTIAERREALKASLAGHSAAVARATEAGRAYIAADKAVNRVDAQIAAKKIEEIRDRIKHAPEHMKEPCKECGKPHTPEELADYLAIQEAQLVEVQVKAGTLARKLREDMDRVRALKLAAEAAHAEIPDVSAVSEEKAQIDALEQAVKDATTRLNTAKMALKAAADKVETERAAKNPYEALVDSLRDERVENASKLMAVNEKLAALRLVESRAAFLVKVFGPAGVRAQILDTVTPYLNSRTSDYLSVLSDGNISAVWSTLTRDSKGDMKEKFTITVTSKTGGSAYALLSGGEQRRVRLACALALQDLVASRASKPFELWIGDEIDDALDPSGLERLMTILERKARERGTVLVVSHNSLSDWCDNITLVTKTARGTSTIEGSLVAA